MIYVCIQCARILVECAFAFKQIVIFKSLKTLMLGFEMHRWRVSANFNIGPRSPFFTFCLRSIYSESFLVFGIDVRVLLFASLSAFSLFRLNNRL